MRPLGKSCDGGGDAAGCRAANSARERGNLHGIPDYAESAIYQAPSGAWVFAAGTIAWSWGLDDVAPSRADARIQKTTANILALFLGAPGATRGLGTLASAAPGFP